MLKPVTVDPIDLFWICVQVGYVRSRQKRDFLFRDTGETEYYFSHDGTSAGECAEVWLIEAGILDKSSRFTEEGLRAIYPDV